MSRSAQSLAVPVRTRISLNLAGSLLDHPEAFALSSDGAGIETGDGLFKQSPLALWFAATRYGMTTVSKMQPKLLSGDADPRHGVLDIWRFPMAIAGDPWRKALRRKARALKQAVYKNLGIDFGIGAHRSAHE